MTRAYLPRQAVANHSGVNASKHLVSPYRAAVRVGHPFCSIEIDDFIRCVDFAKLPEFFIDVPTIAKERHRRQPAGDLRQCILGTGVLQFQEIEKLVETGKHVLQVPFFERQAGPPLDSRKEFEDDPMLSRLRVIIIFYAAEHANPKTFADDRVDGRLVIDVSVLQQLVRDRRIGCPVLVHEILNQVLHSVGGKGNMDASLLRRATIICIGATLNGGRDGYGHRAGRELSVERSEMGCRGVPLAPCAEPSRSDRERQDASASERATFSTHGARGHEAHAEGAPGTPTHWCCYTCGNPRNVRCPSYAGPVADGLRYRFTHHRSASVE